MMASRAPAFQLVCFAVAQGAARSTSGSAVASRPDQDENSKILQRLLVMISSLSAVPDLTSRRSELGAVHPHAVEDHAELSGKCDTGLLVPDLRSQPQRPIPQGATSACAGNQAGCRLEQQRPEQPVAPAGDTT